MSSPIAVQALRTQLFANGFPFVPVFTSEKRAYGTEWPNVARLLTAATAGNWPDAAALNTGILCDGLAPIDVDTDDAALARWIVELAHATLGAAPIRYRANSPKCLILYRSTEQAMKSANVTDTAGKKVLELLGSGRQFVADGTHPTTAPYLWTHELRTIRRDMLTAVSPEQISTFLAAVADRIDGNASKTRIKEDGTASDSTPIPTEDEQHVAATVLKRLADGLRSMSTGQGRNAALNNAALQMGELCAGWGILRQPIAEALLEACHENGYIAKDGPRAAQETLASGFAKGLKQPRARLDEPMDFSKLRIGNVTALEALAALPIKAATAKNVQVAAVRTVVLTGLADVQETAVEWHWAGYLPAGMLTLLSGAGGTGKSTVAFGFDATITTGGLWPDGQKCSAPGNVLIWSSEDDVARTIKPRLMAAGADISKIAVIESTTDDHGNKLPFDPATDIRSLREAVAKAGGISLLIIDPIVSAVAGDMHKANDVRRSLQPIVDFAADFNCAVLGITHFAKNTGGRNASERVIGSQAFAALARMVLVTAKEEDSDLRVFTRAKSNISADDGGIHYTIEALELQANRTVIPTTRVVWGAAIQGNARSILSTVEAEPQDRKPLNQVEEAIQFLRAELLNGPVQARDIIERAKRDLGINERSLQRAREKLGIVPVKAGFQGQWVWGYQLAIPSPLL